jgi:hypothetical protein
MTDVWKGLPKEVRVIGKRYRTRIVDKVDDEESCGESDPVEQTLRLLKAQGFEQARDTVLHEALHGVEHQLNLDLEEQQIHQMATGMLALMRDNPSLVKYLMAKEPKEEPNRGGEEMITKEQKFACESALQNVRCRRRQYDPVISIGDARLRWKDRLSRGNDSTISTRPDAIGDLDRGESITTRSLLVHHAAVAE